MAVDYKTPKQTPVKVFQFASIKFVGYKHFASVLRFRDAYFRSSYILHNFSMDSRAKFSDNSFSMSPRKTVQILSKTSRSRLISRLISRILNTFQNIY